MKIQLLKDVKSGGPKTWKKGTIMEVDHKTAAKWIKDKIAVDATPADPKEIQKLFKNLTTDKNK